MIEPIRARGNHVRRVGVALTPLILAEGAQGVVSAGSPTSVNASLIAVHGGAGFAITGFALWSAHRAARNSGRVARAAAWFTAATLVATSATGTAFLVTGFVQGLPVDRALALIALIGAGFMIIFGSVRMGPPSPAATVGSE